MPGHVPILLLSRGDSTVTYRQAEALAAIHAGPA